ncbi:MAG: gamma-glutamylcyclotransferase family protein [Nanoarchaeota archaeon]
MQEKLFSYGTLQNPEVQIKVVGRALKSTPDILNGFKKTTI